MAFNKASIDPRFQDFMRRISLTRDHLKLIKDLKLIENWPEKGDPGDIPLGTLVLALEKEYLELHDAMCFNYRSAIRFEISDVINVLEMIFDHLAQ